MKVILFNKQAQYHYTLKSYYEAGLVLSGAEVKPIKHGRLSFSSAYVVLHEGALWLNNLKIVVVDKSNMQNTSCRLYKLLLKQKEINKIRVQLSQDRLTVVPVKLYINGRGLVKVTIAVALGKKMYDKREHLKRKEWARQKAILFKKSVR